MHIPYHFSVVIVKTSMPYNTNYNKYSVSKTTTRNVTAYCNVVYCMFPCPINILIPTQPISMLEYFNVMITCGNIPL